MKYRQVSYFCAVVQHGSINRAAKALGVTQPNLSREINSLEKEIKAQLFERGKNGIVLTKEGTHFWNLSHSIVNQMRALESAYLESDYLPSPTLCISTYPQSISNEVIKELVVEWSSKESYSITLLNQPLSGVIESVKQAKSEIGVVFLSPGAEEKYLHLFHAAQLDYFEIAARPPCVNIGRKHPLFSRTSIRLEELDPFPIIRFIEDDITPLDYVQTDYRRFHKIIFSNSDETLAAFTSDTYAFKLGYSWCKELYESQGIACIPIENYSGLLHLGYVCRQGGILSKEALRFIELLKQKYG